MNTAVETFIFKESIRKIIEKVYNIFEKACVYKSWIFRVRDQSFANSTNHTSSPSLLSSSTIMDLALLQSSLQEAYTKLRDDHGSSTILLLSDLLALEHTLSRIALQTHIQTEEAKLRKLTYSSLINEVNELTKALQSRLIKKTSSSNESSTKHQLKNDIGKMDESLE